MLIRFSSFRHPAQTTSTPAIQEDHAQNGHAKWLFRCALWACLAISICHVLSLTLEVTFDGNWYIGLAHILGSNRFPQEWDFLRGPLYPAILKLTFWLCGWQAMAVIGLHSCLAYLAIYLLGRSVRGLGRPLEAALGMVFLSAYPMLIVYEHMLLTEVGTFFFLSLFVFLLTVSNRITIRGALYLCVAITAGFYYRSSLLYLAPLLAIIYCLPLIPPIKAAGLTLRCCPAALGIRRSRP